MRESRAVILERLVSPVHFKQDEEINLFALVVDAALGEIMTTCSKLEWLINHGERALRTETRYSNLMLSYKKSQVVYEPKGVVCAIVSWNYRERICILCRVLSYTGLQHCTMLGHQSSHPSLLEMPLC